MVVFMITSLTTYIILLPPQNIPRDMKTLKLNAPSGQVVKYLTLRDRQVNLRMHTLDALPPTLTKSLKVG
jgi:hypothetical protein